MAQNIAIASDHAGVELKSQLTSYLSEQGYQVTDLGPNSTDSVDYPDYGHKLAGHLNDNTDVTGIAICGSGIGISMALNRHAHIRAALCANAELAGLAREHNNANVLVLGARFTDQVSAKAMVDTFLATNFAGGRHELRVQKI